MKFGTVIIISWKNWFFGIISRLKFSRLNFFVTSWLFIRLVGKHGIKMKGVVAVQRKLLEMVHTIHKTSAPYDESNLQNKKKKK